ncbi:putative enzyme related to lactoylglutathione lyase [Nocardia sp. GAS34]|uniref:VOC family protein n=1 Tax=unclassified Nocardia TaxID=2637762 RepID=UPI003D22295D
MEPANGTVTWFQVGSADPVAAERFYGSLFDWTFRADPGSGAEYQLVTYPGQQVPSGGFDRLDAADTAYAAFCVQVADVGQTCERAVELGGKVLHPAATTPAGLVSAHLLDADGNRFVIFTPAPR